MDHAIGDEERQVLRALSLPAIAPLSDKSAGAVARRTGIEAGRVLEIISGMDALRPRIVRRVEDRGDEFWVTLTDSRRLLAPCAA